MCEGNGTGSGVNQCKKITISPFQTGQVIIQASGLPDGSMRHVIQAKLFIQRVFQTHASEVIRKQYLLPTASNSAAAVAESTTELPHPTSRHLISIPVHRVVETPSASASASSE
jgi:hypothetical protein